MSRVKQQSQASPPVLPSNDDKDSVWKAYHDRKPLRVPVILATNPRVYTLDEQYNDTGLSFEQSFSDPRSMLLSQLKWQELARSVYHRYCDYPAGLPDRWTVGIDFQNVYEAWFFGSPVEFRADQVPDAKPWLAEDNKRAVFDVDIDRPFERDPFRRGIEFTERMMEIAENTTYLDRPVSVNPYLPGTDGAVTIAVALRGGDFLSDLILDPGYADELMDFITQAAVKRINAAHRYWGRKLSAVGYADDAVQMLSHEMYLEKILPHHGRFYDALDPERTLPRSIHLCGNVQRHLPAIAARLGVRSIDTGFPVDFGGLRKSLGPDVEILGGVEVATLLNGSPRQVLERARQILQSGVMDGGRFILREANNLPPKVPTANLEAMYRASLQFGRYD
ncbi:MAG: hypothetical protein JW909_10330 [Planctomycetes bacterium]|nr:hypothetical protein [Planctomycetota bacterium]